MPANIIFIAMLIVNLENQRYRQANSDYSDYPPDTTCEDLAAFAFDFAAASILTFNFIDCERYSTYIKIFRARCGL